MIGSVRTVLAVVVLATAFGAGLHARTITVNSVGTGDYPTIQAAIDDANNGDELVLEPGTYTGVGNQSIMLAYAFGTGLSMTIRSVDPSDPAIVAATVIDCNGLGWGISASMIPEPGTFINGLTIRSSIGAVGCSDGRLRVSNCRFIDNTFGGLGAAIRGFAAYVYVDNCFFSGNAVGLTTPVPGYGGAIYAYESGLLEISNCEFVGNSATDYGGAVVARMVPLKITSSSFRFNSSVASGAISAGKGAEISNCLFEGNTAMSGGGLSGAGACSISNCTFVGNRSTDGGPVIRWWTSSEEQLTITNSIFSGNHSNGGPEIEGASAEDIINVEVAYCLVEGGPNSISVGDDGNLLWGAGNVDGDPCFVDNGYWASAADIDVADDSNDPNAVWVSGDYHLKSQAGRWDAGSGDWAIDDATSACIDAGNWRAPIGVEPFPNGGRVNMGFYGGTAEASRSYFGGKVCETIVAGDINGDCRVDFRDMSLLASNWGNPLLPKPGPATEPSPPDENHVYGPEIELSWTVGEGAVSHDVYFGTESPGEFLATVTQTQFEVSIPSDYRVYFWRIDEAGAWGGKTVGQVWSFRANGR